MKEVTLYTTQFCPFCVRAKHLLESKRIPFVEVDLTSDSEKRREISEKSGSMTVPIIYIGEEFIGGCDELYALENRGELEEKVVS